MPVSIWEAKITKTYPQPKYDIGVDEATGEIIVFDTQSGWSSIAKLDRDSSRKLAELIISLKRR